MIGVKISLDRKQFAVIAGELKVAQQAIAQAQHRALNKVAEKTLTRSRREIVSRVNLKQDYIRDRMALYKASPNHLEAVIAARIRPTRLATYGSKQLLRTAKRAKGDQRRGIPAGKKQAGISVMVSRKNGRKKMPGTFFIPLRAGKLDGGNGMGVFIRSGKEIEHLYGYSVDQVFRYVMYDINDSVQQELTETTAKQVEYELRKALKA